MTERIFCFGDSNTWGYAPGDLMTPRYPRETRWPGVLARLSGREVIEAGLCGRTAAFDDPDAPGRNGARALPRALEEAGNPDYAVIMLGTNDCKRVYGATAQEIGQGLSLCLDILAAVILPSRILVVSPPYLGENVWRPDRDPAFSPESVAVSRELKTVYRAIAAKRGHLFLAASDAVRAEAWDEEHLDPAGHLRLGEAINAALFGGKDKQR